MKITSCFSGKKRKIPEGSMPLSQLRAQIIQESGLNTDIAGNNATFQIPLQKVIQNTYTITSDTKDNDPKVQGSSIFTNQLLIILNNRQNVEENQHDYTNEYEKKLIEYTLAFMAIGLDSGYSGNKSNGSRSRYYPAADLIEELRNRCQDKDALILKNIDFIMRKDFQYVDDAYLIMSPYHFLRTAIYTEIQRIEEWSLDSGRFDRAEKIRVAMFELDVSFDDKLDKISAYNKLKRELDDRDDESYSTKGSNQGTKSNSKKSSTFSEGSSSLSESLLSGGDNSDQILETTNIEGNALSLKQAFEALPYPYAFQRVKLMMDRIEAVLTHVKRPQIR